MMVESLMQFRSCSGGTNRNLHWEEDRWRHCRIGKCFDLLNTCGDVERRANHPALQFGSAEATLGHDISNVQDFLFRTVNGCITVNLGNALDVNTKTSFSYDLVGGCTRRMEQLSWPNGTHRLWSSILKIRDSFLVQISP